MSEIEKLLRFQAPAVKEISTQQLNITNLTTGEIFSTGLTSGYSRKGMYVYNNTDAASGEVYMGELGVTPATGMILEKGDWLEINIGDPLDVYFVAGGVQTELRILEIA
jgi:hypothetical protein